MSTSDVPQPLPQRSWLGRNWKWVVPLGCLATLAMIPLSCAAVVGVLFVSLRNSWAATEGFELARKDPQVIQALGEPITSGWLVMGNISVEINGTGHAEMTIPILGPNGTGTVYVIAKKQGGEWKFKHAEVQIDGQRERIDLLKKRDDTARSRSRAILFIEVGRFPS